MNVQSLPTPSATVPAEAQIQRRKRSLFLCYLLLFCGCLIVDQSTKLHAERAFLADYDQSAVMRYYPSEQHVFSLGMSPVEAREAQLPPTAVSKNWLVFDLTYLRNVGAVWGMFHDLPDPWRTWLFYAVTAVAMVILYQFFRQTTPEQRLYRVALVFILSGALGNFIDRLALRYVIDWLHFYWRIWGWEYSFPVFNLADVFINVGVGSILLDTIWTELRARKGARGEKSAHGPTTPEKLDPQGQ